MITSDQRDKIRAAFRAGKLKTRSVSPLGEAEWQPIQASHQVPIPLDLGVVRVSTAQGSMVLTEDHRVFVSPTEKLEAGRLGKGAVVLGQSGEPVEVGSVSPALYEAFMYDITVAEHHNFAVVECGVIVSNCPDKNYRFRPPEGEGTVGCYNQVFGQIWTDAEFAEYLEIALWKWNIHPPNTDQYSTIDRVCQQKPSWQAALLWGALVNAAQALAYNWVSDEFSVAPDTLVTVHLPDGREVSLPIEELYEICSESV